MTREAEPQIRYAVPWIYLFRPIIDEIDTFRVFPRVVELNPRIVFLVVEKSQLYYFRKDIREFYSIKGKKLTCPPIFGTSKEAVDEWLNRRATTDGLTEGGLIAWQALADREVAVVMQFEVATATGKMMGYSIIPENYKANG